MRKVSKREREWVLDDGDVWTVKKLKAKTRWAHGTCYARLNRCSTVECLLAPLTPTQTGKVYTLDDGSKWTGDELAEYLNCKRTTAGTRLSMMNGDSKRILAPVKNPIKDSDMYLNDKEVQEYVEQRMYYDKQGHWKLINKFI